jgi:hypothetical protein
VRGRSPSCRLPGPGPVAPAGGCLCPPDWAGRWPVSQALARMPGRHRVQAASVCLDPAPAASVRLPRVSLAGPGSSCEARPAR